MKIIAMAAFLKDDVTAVVDGDDVAAVTTTTTSAAALTCRHGDGKRRHCDD